MPRVLSEAPERLEPRWRILSRNIGPLDIYRPSRRWTPGNRPDVVLLQGFGTGPRAVDAMAQRLSETHGLCCCVPRLGGLFGYLQTRSVGRAGRALAEFLATLSPEARPWLIGHSIGGMIARYAVQHASAGDRVSGVITLGCPHRGAPIAVAGLALGLGLVSRSPWQILPLSRAVRRLNALPWPADVPLVSLVSSADVLCPPRFGKAPFEGQPTNRTVHIEGLGHTELLRHPAVIDCVAGVVGGAER